MSVYRNEETMNRKRATAGLVIVALFCSIVTVLALGWFFWAPLNAVVQYQSLDDTVAVTGGMPSLPVRLRIPEIGVDAFIQHVGISETELGDMDAPSNFTDVGWYRDGVRPGQSGSSVIAGHYNGKNIREAVFFELRRVSIGDEVVVIGEEGTEQRFRVVRVATYPFDAPTNEVFVSDDGVARLNLITCDGAWIPSQGEYSHRTVVFTELVPVVLGGN